MREHEPLVGTVKNRHGEPELHCGEHATEDDHPIWGRCRTCRRRIFCARMGENWQLEPDPSSMSEGPYAPAHRQGP